MPPEDGGMRAYRFVHDLGEAATEASRSVAAAADVTAAHHGGLGAESGSLNSRAGTELIRQLARETANRDPERVAFDGRSVRLANSEATGEREIVDVGLAVSIDLPTYAATNVVVASVVHEAQLQTDRSQEGQATLRRHVKSLLDETAAAYVFLVSDEHTRVIPGRSIVAIEGPITQETIEKHLYSRSLGRFVAMLAEGFLGVDGLPTDPEPVVVDPADESSMRTWGSRHDVQGVCALSVSASADEAATSLTPFLD